ncbi:MAG: T9SS type A sorting domain-containing protein [Bacteroidia bacterium]
MNQLLKKNYFLLGIVFVKRNNFLKSTLALNHILCLFIAICSFQVGFAATINYNTYRSGNWNETGQYFFLFCNNAGTWTPNACGSINWCNDVLPIAADNVTICAGNTVTLTDNRSITNVTVNGTLIINTGKTLTMSGTLTINNGGSVILNGTAAINVMGDVILNSGGSLATNGTSTMAVGGNWTNNGGTFTPGTTTITFNGTGAQAINGSATSQTFYNVVVAKTAGQTLSVLASTVTLTTNNLTLTTGNFTAPATLNINSTATATLTLTAGTFIAGANVYITGNWTNNGGTFTPGSNTVTFTGTGAQAINGSVTSQTFYNVVVAKTAGQILSVTTSTITLTTNNLTLTTGNFTAPATLNINSTATATLTLTAGTFIAGTNVYINGNWTNNGGTFTPGTNTVTFTGTGAQAINGSATSQTFYNVVVAKTAGQTLSVTTSTIALTTNNLTLTTGNFTAPATLNINSTATATLTLTAGTFIAGTNVYINGNWTNNGGTFTPGTNTVTFTGTGAQAINGTVASQVFYDFVVSKTALQTLSVSGNTTTLTTNNFTMSNGDFIAPPSLTTNVDFTLNNGTYTAGANYLYIKGNCYITGGNFIVGTGTITFNGTSSQTLNFPGSSIDFYNLTLALPVGQSFILSGSVTAISTQNFTQTSGNFNAPITFTINGNTTLTSGTLTAGTNIYVNGNWTNNGATFTPGTGTITFSGTGAQAIDGSATSQTFYNVVVAKTSGQTLSVGGSTNTLTTNNFTLTTGNFTAPTTINVSSTPTANLTLASGTFTAGSIINITGNWTNTGGIINGGTCTATFMGTSAQIIGGLIQTTFYNLVLNNTAPTSPQITLARNTDVVNKLTMTAGKTNLAGYTLTLGASSAVPGSLDYTAGWLYGGDFKRYFNTSAIVIGAAAGHFPIGSAYDYRPFWVSHTLSLLTGGSITVSHTGIYPCFRQTVNFIDLTWGLGTTVKYLSESYWSMSMSGIGSLLSVFTVRAQATGLGLVNNVNDLNLSLSSGVLGLFSSSAGTITNPQVNRTGLSVTNLLGRGTNTFYVGSKTNLSPLPISLLKFDAHLQDNKTVAVNWATASETNNDYFTVEKSADAINFEKVVSIKGAGNTTMMVKYNTTDYNPLTGQSYYRLKQIDFDGKFTYSNIIAINAIADQSLTIFPNPSSTNDNIQMNIPNDLKGKEVLINVHDLQGRNIYSESLIVDNIKKSTTIISEKLNSGSYMINIISGNTIYKQLLIVR